MFAAALRENDTLKYFSLVYNDIDSDAAVTVLQALKVNVAVTRLEIIGHLGHDAEVLASFAYMLKANVGLEACRCDYTLGPSEEVEGVLNTVLETNVTLKSFSLVGGWKKTAYSHLFARNRSLPELHQHLKMISSKSTVSVVQAAMCCPGVQRSIFSYFLPAGVETTTSHVEVMAEVGAFSDCPTLLEGEDSVLSHIEHNEPAMKISEAEADDIVRSQDAGFVERNMLCGVMADEDEGQSDSDIGQADEAIFLCKLNRNTHPIRKALREGLELQSCRASLEEHGHPWKHVLGALVFVHPCQYRMVMRALDSIDLKPDHLIVSASLEHLVAETVADWAQQRGGFCKSRDQLNMPSSSDAASAGDLSLWTDSSSNLCDACFELVERRTFLCEAPRLRHAETVNQSTTEADSRKGLNPRRVVVQAM